MERERTVFDLLERAEADRLAREDYVKGAAPAKRGNRTLRKILYP